MNRSLLAIPSAGAACLALLLVGCTSSSDEAGPSATPTESAASTAGPNTVNGHFTGSDPTVAFTYTLPEGWISEGGFLMAGPAATVNFWDVGDVYADGCRWTLLDPPLGPRVDDLANVWAELPGFKATPPVDVTIDGYAGKRVDYTVPDYDDADCLGNRFGLWREDNSLGGPSFWAQVPKQQNRQWIIDVDGTRLVINEWSEPGTTPDQLAETDRLLDSIQIG